DFFGFFILNFFSNFLSHINDYEKSGTPYSYYTYIFEECIYFMKENRSLIDNVVKSNMFSTLLDIFADEIYKDVYGYVEEHPEDVDKLHIPHDILAAFYTGGIVQSIRLWFTNYGSASDKDFIQGITTLIESVQPKK
ncbi:MAG: TetR family transcriptional regulator C-terminal domain-containing protein, partial [Lachnospiraceae bacterium]|nr:TetR family transcriptional regulator C-terminal domain-containing protein [Lachnospiraceae bacterium]